MTWATPKIDWVPADGLGIADYNRIEENTQELRTPTEGSNERMGVESFSGSGTISVVISNTSVTANTRIFVTINSWTNSDTGGPPSGPLFISARTPGTSFTISFLASTGAPADAVLGTIAWKLYEPHS